MTPKEWRSLARYLRDIGNILGLRDWTFELLHQPCDGDAYASIDCIFGRKVARVQVCAGWKALKPEVQRNSIVHELIHAHMNGMHAYVYHALPSLLGEASWSAFESAFRMQEELATDGIADGISAGFPLWEG